ncbi:MAG: ABC transporter substrate-binding protein [Oscillospiraceae bacterium]|nr:ABC transporter substrate-binding protein [Oscillospiraceae bacterium]
MERTIKKVCCLLVLCLLSGCAGSAGTSYGKDLLVVGFSQLGSESDWRIANTQSMIQALSEENGYELLFDNAKQKQENQLIAIRNFILQGVDIIVLAPDSETGWDNVLYEARDAGIPVIIVDREVSVEDDSLYLSSVGSDFLKEGRLAVDWLEKELTRQGRSDEEIKILHIKGTDGATAQLMRTKAIEDAVLLNSRWTISDQLSGEFTDAKGYEVVRDYLKTNQDIDVIYSENDNMTFGAMRALDEAGLTYGENGDVIIISFDAVREALGYCLEGRINLCVECNPLHGPRVDELIKKYESGEEIPKHTYVEETCFTRSNLSLEIIDSREY